MTGPAPSLRGARRWLGSLSLLGSLTLLGCGNAGPALAPSGSVDASSSDAIGEVSGAPDTSTPDAITPDTITPDTITPDAGTPDSSDANAASTDSGTLDAASVDGAGGCGCGPKQVWRNGACVGTPKLGCAATCKPAGCPTDQVCDAKAAVLSCTDATPAPACIAQQSMGFPPGELRVSPLAAKTGVKTTLTVVGGHFYIGALWWVVGVGPDVIDPVDETSAACTLKAAWTGKQPGVYAVRVGYGGLRANLNKGGLAGFVRVSDDGAPPLGVQPGYPCDAQTVCTQGDGWVCACGASQRCNCTKKP